MGELGLDDGLDEFAEGLGVELMAGDLAEGLPVKAVSVEDAGAEKVGEGGVEVEAFGVEVEVGFEDVVDVGGVGGEGLAEAERAVEDEGGGGGLEEEVREPLVPTVSVLEDVQRGSHQRVAF